MSSEPTELKAGHPPAVKAGGKRVVTKHRHEEPDSDAYDQKYVDSLPEPPNQHILMSAAAAFPKVHTESSNEAVRVAHSKPVPTTEKAHSPSKMKQNIRINQPRKMN